MKTKRKWNTKKSKWYSINASKINFFFSLCLISMNRMRNFHDEDVINRFWTLRSTSEMKAENFRDVAKAVEVEEV